MKNILLSSLLIISSVSINAQVSDLSSVPKKWTPGSIGFNALGNWDVYTSMTLDQMLDHASRPEDIMLDLNGYTENAYKTVTGVGLSGDFSFFKNGNPNRELRFGLNLITGREGIITYSKSTMHGDTINEQNITYCNMDNEWGVSGSYFIKKGNRFKVFTGISANIGGSFGKSMVLLFNRASHTEDYSYFEHEDWKEPEIYQADPSLYVRARIPLGISYTFFKRADLSLSTNLGVGAQKILGGKTYFMGHTGAVMFGVRYHLNRL